MPTAANTNFNPNPPRVQRKLEPDDPNLYSSFVDYGNPGKPSGPSSEEYSKGSFGYKYPKGPSGKNLGNGR